jgi:hypothetical protein
MSVNELQDHVMGPDAYLRFYEASVVCLAALGLVQSFIPCREI